MAPTNHQNANPTADHDSTYSLSTRSSVRQNDEFALATAVDDMIGFGMAIVLGGAVIGGMLWMSSHVLEDTRPSGVRSEGWYSNCLSRELQSQPDRSIKSLANASSLCERYAPANWKQILIEKSGR